MKNIKIERALQNDLSLMQRLFYQTVTSFGVKVFTDEEVKIYSRLALDKNHWFKKFEEEYIYNAKLNGEILGSFNMNKDGFIEYIFVDMNYQGKGIANKLYQKIEEIAIQESIQVLSTNINALTKIFFEKKGFEIIKNSTQVVGGEEVVTLKAVKNLF